METQLNRPHLKIEGCVQWSYNLYIRMVVSRVMNGAEDSRALLQEVIDKVSDDRNVQTFEGVKVQEPSCHDFHREVLKLIFKKERLWNDTVMKFSHDQTYVSLTTFDIPDRTEADINTSEKCDFLITVPQAHEERKYRIIYSLELKPTLNVGPRVFLSYVEQLKGYLKNSIAASKKTSSYGALADLDHIIFFKMEVEGEQYVTYNSRLYDFPTAIAYKEDMWKGLCYFITMINIGRCL